MNGILICVILAIGLIVGYFIWNNKRKNNLRIEQENLLLQRKMAIEQYEMLKDQVALSHKFRDEITSHMQTLENILQNASMYSKETEVYVESLRRQYDQLCSMEYCDEIVIDACICARVSTCKEKHIHTDVDLSHSFADRFEEIDFMELISLLFDLAIEKAEQSDEKWIRMECHCEEEKDILSMTYSVKENTKQKSNSRILKRITEIVGKYGGKVVFEEEASCNTVVISNGELKECKG